MKTELIEEQRTQWRKTKNFERGISLISTCVMIMVIGILMSAVMSFYNIGHSFKAEARTQTNLNLARRALELHNAMEGRLPCPAPLSAAVDTAKFGLEVGTDCTVAPVIAGETFQVKGRDDRLVRIGALPVRTLNIDEDLMFDGHDRRLIYAVTEEYAVDGATVSGDRGAITLQDRSANVATSVEGNGIFVLLSPGRDGNGAYSFDGGLLQACDTSKESGENCDFQVATGSDAVFVHSAQTDANETDPFLHQSTYMSSEVPACTYEREFDNHAFFVDAAGFSSAAPVENCPPGYASCTVGDVVFWGLHRVIPSIIDKKLPQGDSRGETFLASYGHYSGYGPSRAETNIAETYSSVYSSYGGGNNVAIDTPNRYASRYMTYPDSPVKEFEHRVPYMCRHFGSKYGGTAFGNHIEALIEIVADGARVSRGRGPFTRTKKITVIAPRAEDSQHTVYQKNRYKRLEDVLASRGIASLLEQHVEVDVIDIRPDGVATETDVSTRNFKALANAGGGQYYRVNSAEELLETLRKSSGTCELYDPTIEGGPAAATRSYCK